MTSSIGILRLSVLKFLDIKLLYYLLFPSGKEGLLHKCPLLQGEYSGGCGAWRPRRIQQIKRFHSRRSFSPHRVKTL